MGFEMVSMPNDTQKQRLGLIKFALPLICLTVTACDKAPPFPGIKVYETARNPETGEYLCGEYKANFTVLNDKVDIKFSPTLDHPLSQCEGVFGFKLIDFPAIITWIEDTIKYYRQKIEEAKQNAKF